MHRLLKQLCVPLVFWGILWMSYATVALGANCSNQLSPILFVPGVTGSQIEARIQGSPGGSCDSEGFESMWINEQKLVQTDYFGSSCFEYGLTLQFEEPNIYNPRCGVSTKIPGAAGTDITKVEYQDPLSIISYAKDMVEYFVARGYVRDFSIRAMPYDWRLAADNLARQGYYSQMQGVIEEMYEQNNQTRVTLVVHSMGGPISLYFLNNVVDQGWKDKYIYAYIPLSGAWDGGATMVEVLLSGLHYTERQGFFVRPNLRNGLRDIARTSQGCYWLVPSPDSLGAHHVIAEVGSDQYTIAQYNELFQRAGIEKGFTKYTNVKAINTGWIAPNVSTHCFYGLSPGENNTPDAFIYEADRFPNHTPSVRMGLGDTAVNVQISEICLQWRNQTAGFTNRTFATHHRQMISDRKVLAAIGEVVGAPQDPLPTSGGFCPATFATVLTAMALLALQMI